MAPSVVSMSTLYVLSLRTEEDLVESDGYVPGGLAASRHQARWGLARVREPWRMSPVKGAPPQDLSLLGDLGGGRAGGGSEGPLVWGEAAALLSC